MVTNYDRPQQIRFCPPTANAARPGSDARHRSNRRKATMTQSFRSTRSLGTSAGMICWYRFHVPRCKSCHKTYLTTYERREIGLCAKCERQAQATAPEPEQAQAEPPESTSQAEHNAPSTPPGEPDTQEPPLSR
jgi:hypothetical protein